MSAVRKKPKKPLEDLRPGADEAETWACLRELTPSQLSKLARSKRSSVVIVRLARLALLALSTDVEQREAALKEVRDLEGRGVVRSAVSQADGVPGEVSAIFHSEDEALLGIREDVSAEEFLELRGALAELPHLTPRQRIAALLFAVNPVATRAAKAAGYGNDSSTHARMFRRPSMQAAVGLLRERLEEQFLRRIVHERARVFERYQAMADFDPLPYVTPDGLDIDRLRREQSGQVFVNAIDVDARRRRVRVKFADQAHANDRLAQITGLTTPPQSGGGGEGRDALLTIRRQLVEMNVDIGGTITAALEQIEIRAPTEGG